MYVQVHIGSTHEFDPHITWQRSARTRILRHTAVRGSSLHENRAVAPCRRFSGNPPSTFAHSLEHCFDLPVHCRILHAFLKCMFAQTSRAIVVIATLVKGRG
jgi:hypothetical protein